MVGFNGSGIFMAVGSVNLRYCRKPVDLAVSGRKMLLIVAIAWIYVVLMMSIAEHSVIAGIMTFLLYCVLPLTIVLYLMATPRRRRHHKAEVLGAAGSQPDGSERSINASATSFSSSAPSDLTAGSQPDATSGTQPNQ
jgi:small-conductance mechanosensitive channel